MDPQQARQRKRGPDRHQQWSKRRCRVEEADSCWSDPEAGGWLPGGSSPEFEALERAWGEFEDELEGLQRQTGHVPVVLLDLEDLAAAGEGPPPGSLQEVRRAAPVLLLSRPAYERLEAFDDRFEALAGLEDDCVNGQAAVAAAHSKLLADGIAEAKAAGADAVASLEALCAIAVPAFDDAHLSGAPREVDGCFSSGPLEAPGEDCCSDFGSLPAVPWELPDDDLPKISPPEMSDKDHADLDKLPPVPCELSDDDTPETDSLPSFPPPELTAGSEVTRRSSTPGAPACCNEVPQEPPPLECGSLPSTAAPSRCSLVESNPGCQEGPGCPECDKPMIWSLYSQGDYDIGWMCQYGESCGASEVRPCVPRWFCQGCHVDVCGACRAPPAWGEHEGHCSEALGGGLPGERRVSPWGGPKEPPEERPSMQVQRSVVQRHAGP